ncbi:MAG TPA: sigma-70 family RNA polymerase sigma factor [Fimbriiglobus sp.]|nr:sigma-70 family RNA polymerase sigma factor [Fimbriiglobus sp.]
MDASDDTRPSLIARVRDPQDGTAWTEFAALYAPLIQRAARRAGLQEADADDLTQDVLRSVAGSVGGLELRPGAFRRWLYTVVRNRVTDFYKSAQRRDRGAGDTAALERLAEVPAPLDEADWDREYERRMLAWAADRVRGEFQPSTWRAFWLTAVDGRPGPEAARELGLSLGAVHVARSRVLARLKAVVREHLGEE